VIRPEPQVGSESICLKGGKEGGSLLVLTSAEDLTRALQPACCQLCEGEKHTVGIVDFTPSEMESETETLAGKGSSLKTNWEIKKDIMGRLVRFFLLSVSAWRTFGHGSCCSFPSRKPCALL